MDFLEKKQFAKYDEVNINFITTIFIEQYFTLNALKIASK
jgi:hypothetical protein